MDVINTIQKIFQEKFQIEVAEIYFSRDFSLSSSGIGFNAIELLYLIYYIEAEFNIKFTAEHFSSGKIRTLPGLCSAIQELKK